MLRDATRCSEIWWVKMLRLAFQDLYMSTLRFLLDSKCLTGGCEGCLWTWLWSSASGQGYFQPADRFHVSVAPFKYNEIMGLETRPSEKGVLFFFWNCLRLVSWKDLKWISHHVNKPEHGTQLVTCGPRVDLISEQKGRQLVIAVESRPCPEVDVPQGARASTEGVQRKAGSWA